jgi:S-formylglutathione hydrolase FrmB
MVRVVRRAGVAAAAALALAGVAASAPPHLNGSVLERSFSSRALKDELPFEVYLPPGYAKSSRRYPVVYFLHGLPATPSSFRDVRLFTRAIERVSRRAIVVAPRGARAGEDDPEYLDWRPGRRWETAIGEELPDVVDADFRTVRSRRGRALIGISAGGHGATLIGLHHLGRFSVVESWSGYFHPTNRRGDAPLDLGSPARNRHASAHSFVARLGRAFRQRPTLLGFYVGDRDPTFRAENLRLHRELSAAGVPHVFRLYRGGHAQALWSRHATAWLGLALRHLATS